MKAMETAMETAMDNVVHKHISHETERMILRHTIVNFKEYLCVVCVKHRDRKYGARENKHDMDADGMEWHGMA